jgi:hypothetical protein
MEGSPRVLEMAHGESGARAIAVARDTLALRKITRMHAWRVSFAGL